MQKIEELAAVVCTAMQVLERGVRCFFTQICDTVINSIGRGVHLLVCTATAGREFSSCGVYVKFMQVEEFKVVCTAMQVEEFGGVYGNAMR